MQHYRSDTAGPCMEDRCFKSDSVHVVILGGGVVATICPKHMNELIRRASGGWSDADERQKREEEAGT